MYKKLLKMTHHMHQGTKEYLTIVLDEHGWNSEQWAQLPDC
jgi:hypothetical protein